MAGLWYEELEEGMVFEHELSRTVTEAPRTARKYAQQTPTTPPPTTIT